MIRILDKPIRRVLLPNQVNAWGIFCEGVLVWKYDPQVVEITQTGAISIPAFARFIDFVLIGGGSSGQTGNGAVGVAGRGGNPGDWLGVTIERGVEIPWTTSTASIVVGDGGEQAPNNDFAQPIEGQPSVVSMTGMSSILAPGGFGTRSENSQLGKAAPNFTYNGRNYVGGLGGVEDDMTGKAPGGAGAGGFGGTFGNRQRGWPGGKGKVWAIFRSF
ncbi:hypothetical protein SEA_AVAZAK_26 [Gordonia phage Avazak]|uniref:Glycine-rich domain-containing protein n=1 Tax=Gordonia phage Avazak TaxID=2656529 RepID=A0A649V6K2_9CAUD|nr:minor tail protein [Gordonia phage Avazak]QGJ88008.1 hypothetical protein SEA_AVAZAK_26 [Gordonia phage Avazak]